MRRKNLLALLALLALPACVEAGPGYYGRGYGYGYAPGWYSPGPAYVAPAPRWGYGPSYGYYRPAPRPGWGGGWRNDGWRGDGWRGDYRGGGGGGGWSRPPAPPPVASRDFGGTPRQNAIGGRLLDDLQSRMGR